MRTTSLNFLENRTMPHFVIECPRALHENVTLDQLVTAVIGAVQQSNLFRDSDIKVRAVPYDYYKCGVGQDQFIHVTCSIMQGRTDVQKKILSKLVCQAVYDLVPTYSFISVEVRDLSKASYSTKTDCS